MEPLTCPLALLGSILKPHISRGSRKFPRSLPCWWTKGHTGDLCGRSAKQDRHLRGHSQCSHLPPTHAQGHTLTLPATPLYLGVYPTQVVGKGPRNHNDPCMVGTGAPVWSIDRTLLLRARVSQHAGPHFPLKRCVSLEAGRWHWR